MMMVNQRSPDAFASLFLQSADVPQAAAQAEEVAPRELLHRYAIV